MAERRREEMVKEFRGCVTWEEVKEAAAGMEERNELPNDTAMALLRAYAECRWEKEDGSEVRVSDVQELMLGVYGIEGDLCSFLNGRLGRIHEHLKAAYSLVIEYEGICNSVGLAFAGGVRTVGSTDFSYIFGMTPELDGLLDEVKGQLAR